MHIKNIRSIQRNIKKHTKQKRKKHSTKHHYMTMLIVNDAMNRSKVVKYPKWLKYPILLTICGIMAYFFHQNYATIAYIQNLETRVNSYDKTVESLNSEIKQKDSQIINLENTNQAHYNELKSIREKSLQIQQAFKDLEEHKQIIDSKLNGSEKTTNSHPSPPTEVGQAESIVQIDLNSDNFSISKFERQSFQSQINSLQDELVLVENAMKEETQDYEKLDDELDELIPYWDAYPSILPLNGPITSPFGWRKDPIAGYYDFHKGVDVKASYGTSIHATGGGTVIFSGYNGGYGYSVVINHGYGITTRYAHASKLLVKKGDHVNRGDVIAKVGVSGRSTGPHVHYEVRLYDEVQNPLNYVYKGES